MKNSIILQLQNFKPITKNFTWIYSLLLDKKIDIKIRHIIDSCLTNFVIPSSVNTEEKFFYTATRALLASKIKIVTQRCFISNLVKYEYTNQSFTYKVVYISNTTKMMQRFIYFNNIDEIGGFKVLNKNDYNELNGGLTNNAGDQKVYTESQ